MKHKLLSVGLGVPLVFGLGSLAGLQAGAPPTSVAVVDFERVYNSYPKKKQRFAVLKEDRNRTDAALAEKERELQKLDSDAALYDQLEPKWIEARAGLEAASTALKSRAKWEQQRLTREAARIRDECFGDIQRAVAALASQRGIDLVLRMRTVSDGTPLQDRVVLQTQTDVLYAAAKLDLTDDVIKRLLAGAGAAPENGK